MTSLNLKAIKRVGVLFPDSLTFIKQASDFFALLEREGLEGQTHLTYKSMPWKDGILVCFGGDEALFKASCMLFKAQAPIFAVQESLNDKLATLSPAIFSHPEGFRRCLWQQTCRVGLEINVCNTSGVIWNDITLDGIVFSQTMPRQVVTFEVWIDQRFATAYEADGLKVLTPSAQIHDQAPGTFRLSKQLAAIALIPVAPRGLSHRPIVIPAASRVTITLAKAKKPLVLTRSRKPIKPFSLGDQATLWGTSESLMLVQQPIEQPASEQVALYSPLR